MPPTAPTALSLYFPSIIVSIFPTTLTNRSSRKIGTVKDISDLILIFSICKSPHCFLIVYYIIVFYSISEK